MKYFIVIFSILFLSSCTRKDKFDLTNVPQQDIYKEYHIYYELKKQAGKKEGSRELNDQLYIDVYVPDFSVKKAEDVCKFYDEYCKTMANEVDKRLTINIDIWSKKIEKSEKDNPKIQDQYYKGGLIDNYYNNIKEQNIYN